MPETADAVEQLYSSPEWADFYTTMFGRTFWHREGLSFVHDRQPMLWMTTSQGQVQIYLPIREPDTCVRIEVGQLEDWLDANERRWSNYCQ